ncbi:type I restriction-modification system subunit M [Mycoplasmopsis agassizii]|uniref:site-specific DNA-methyltransferase (adenine-specific) n=1 Tax=Mycoplasmopsis agassizii TaxID=33922 RepID=A0ABX4H5C0_9BACT|nr:type I restriction-modification system subunit M [Mycoplasmopsis agassizii]PAF55091.1 type I restriction-modification system subunit M [Mycoplasmopsis agassizii]SMC19948.1 type I restriction enzyme M protein [Mycoplasmopsis agassizii]
MDTKKEQERAELHRTIWEIANDLRGAVSGWDFKQYVLGMMFYRFISENITNSINKNEHDSGYTDFNYANLSDEEANKDDVREDIINEKGFFILPSQLFENVIKNADEDKLNITLGEIFKSIESSANGKPSEKNIKGLFADVDVNSSRLGKTDKEKNARLKKIMVSIKNWKIGNYSDNTIDAFGDAYEYLMGMYAADGGKLGGEFFTPQEVSELLVRLTLIDFTNKKVDENGNVTDVPYKSNVANVYDPACGSGSLLLKYAKFLGKDNIEGFYGQEINLTTFNLARINMFLHDISYDRFNIAYGDTLISPDKELLTLKESEKIKIDAVVSNPPYSIKWDGDRNPLLASDKRFNPATVLAPKSNADYAFIMHILYLLSQSGTAAIVEFPGILYRKGAEATIRKYLVRENLIDSIIQLPKDLFFGTTISTVVMILRKNKANDNKILFVDASNEFVKAGKGNKLNSENINKILDVIRFKKEEKNFSKYVSYDEIVDKGYNLSVNTYVEKEDKREVINIKELNTEISSIVHKTNYLRNSIDQIVKEIEN